jgi:4-amino-4-deoxy-L-arabinose transferase-like glycosyltransferase
LSSVRRAAQTAGQTTKGDRLSYLALVPIAALLIWYSQTRAFSWDEGYHLLAAQLVAHGQRPYLDFCFPQPPLNTYWNALWMRLLGETWRVPHAVAAIMVLIAAWLISGFARSRFPDAAARTTAALMILIVAGLNVLIVQYGAIGQAYAFTLVAITAAYRLALRAAESGRLRYSALAGLAVGCGAAATLLSAPVGVVLLIWLVVYNRTGNRWRKAAALIAGAAAAFLPVFWLFALNPRATFFNIVQYELLYRQVEWEGAYAHDAKIWVSWLGSSHGLVIGVLALVGLVFIKYRSQWTRPERAEFYLAAWLAAALLLHVSQAHPTFAQYYMLAVPFLAVLVSAAIYALGTRWAAIGLAVLMSAGLAKTIAEEYAYTWRDFEPLARRVAELVPPGAPILADEQIYFLTRRTPPSGMELNDSHKLDFGPADMRALHLTSEEEVERRIRTRQFALVESCGEYEAFDDAASQTYPRKQKIGTCTIYW